MILLVYVLTHLMIRTGYYWGVRRQQLLLVLLLLLSSLILCGGFSIIYEHFT